MAQYLEPFALFCRFMALKLHFTNKYYNFVECRGVLKNHSYETFVKRTDSSIFSKLSKIIPVNEVIPYFISQFIGRTNICSINDIVINPRLSYDIWNDWLDRIEDIKGLYKKDMKLIAEKANGSWKTAMKCVDGDYPLVFKMVCSGQISPETYACINDVFSQAKNMYSMLENDTMFMSVNFKYMKYRYFINISTNDILDMTPRQLGDVL